MHELLLQNMAKYVSLTSEEQEQFAELFEPKSLKTKQFLLQEGEICRHSAFVVKGCLKGFGVDKNGFEHILQFAPSGWWIADLYSLISQKPAILNIQAVEATDLLLIRKEKQEAFCLQVPKVERFFRILMEHSLVSHQQRILDNLSLTAEERYQRFCEKYPDLIHCLPQKEIAAYIGVTPEFFSKMRSRLLRKTKG